MSTFITHDIAVIGGGHAGVESALAAARNGCDTIMFAISLDSIALMPCNPNIGGTSKGHLVREIDALGGEMARNADKCLLQIRMLNTAKGPAVWSLRGQVDKRKYADTMRQTIENTDNLSVRQSEIADIEPYDKKYILTTTQGEKYLCSAVILAGGTYFKARCLYGANVQNTGAQGFQNASCISGALSGLGIKLLRFKTGTPARLDGRTLDYEQMVPQKGDSNLSFSFGNIGKTLIENEIPSYLTYTNAETHRIIRDNLHKSAMYSGLIEGTGARYCPSIEDKVMRFADKDAHQVFIEPEGAHTNEMYAQGLSTSLPVDVQRAFYRTIRGLERCEIMRPGYAIEYDCIDATALELSLMFRDYPGLFSAGQINGSSGYEEAAAQGLIAGINAVKYIKNEKPIIIRRNEGYIGVLIDDLVTKGVNEPYRMMTSRAEYRLLLRQDNADLRLTAKGYEAGLVSSARHEIILEKSTLIDREVERLKKTVLPPSDKVNDFLRANNCAPLTTGIRMFDLIKRQELSYAALENIDEQRRVVSPEVAEQINIQIKFDGYIKRQLAQIERWSKMEDVALPDDFDYNLTHLRLEARQKLSSIRPANLGQAMRITGVSPADISVLTIALANHR